MDSHGGKPLEAPWFWPYDFDELLRAVAAREGLEKAVGAVNPRPPGWHNGLIQLLKKVLARSLSWYTRPSREFNASVSRSLAEIVRVLDHLSMNMVAIEARLAQSEKQNAAVAESIAEQRDLLHKQVESLAGLRGSVNQNVRSSDRFRLPIDAVPDRDRTAYVIGLFGTGRRYINELIQQNIGERAKYFRDTIRLHPGPTPMIYSGHATMRYVCRGQESPAVMGRILKAVGSGFAKLIFVYRHPLDSLLTNWVWWRTFIRDNRAIAGISQVYRDTDHLCADLEQNFAEFKAFAEGDPDFFARVPGPHFLSFAQFIEETELHLHAANLVLRLEDFAADPIREFSKIAANMSVDLDLSRLYVDHPRAKPHGYLAVRDKVPRFGDFIDGLNAETKQRIERIGYALQG